MRLLGGVLALGLLAGCTTATAEPPSTPSTAVSAAPAASTPATPAATPTPTPGIDADAVSARLAKVNRDGIARSGVVVLTDTGETVTGRDADTPLAPASTMKLLTGITALDLLGADHTFTTKVVSPERGRLVLVGGGDPLLTDKASKSAAKAASLETLAAATADALAAAGVKKVRLDYDAALFHGPDYSPRWDRKWRSYLARVSPLLVDEGRFNPWQSDPEPALTAANAFAKRLRDAGLRVTRVAAASAPSDAEPVAAVQSAPLSAILARTLRLSDNLAAEVIARHVAIAADREPTFDGATAAVQAWLEGHGLWDDGMRLVDGSGLAKRGRVTPSVLARVVATSLNTPELGALADGLPVAGRSGTLKTRFNDPVERIGRGNVHAKTGTLQGVGALAGYLTTKDGQRLVFAEIGNGVVGQTTGQNWLDRTAAALARCGCS
ncbi:MAG: D-alanyl-D-alanine carboxypeptidase/D-alanyl-D-alanine-endopeptidase [Propionibacteriaceae bacterium]|nr:D-alanyl-D-alanine carboxypeptidase/D-alanyl-D-alanine-endopeptidase [Propionibacteriaceae bacterium]